MSIVKFVFFTAMKFQVEFLRIVTPCGVVVGYQRFEEAVCLHLQGEDLDLIHICS